MRSRAHQFLPESHCDRVHKALVLSIISLLLFSNLKGDFIEYVGGYGAEPGSVRYPTGVTGDGVGRLVISERIGGRIQEYMLPGAVYATPEEKSPATESGSVVVDPESAD
jgi:hypothetical protein